MYPATHKVCADAYILYGYFGWTSFVNLMKDSNFLASTDHTGLILSADGVPVFKSSKGSLWPVYLSVTSIPPAERINADKEPS